jgi:hypothetical protein
MFYLPHIIQFIKRESGGPQTGGGGGVIKYNFQLGQKRIWLGAMYFHCDIFLFLKKH